MIPLFNHSATSVIVVASISVVHTVSTECEPRPAVLPARKLQDQAIAAYAGCQSTRTFATLCCFASAALAALLRSYRHPTEEKGDVKRSLTHRAAKAAGADSWPRQGHAEAIKWA